MNMYEILLSRDSDLDAAIDGLGADLPQVLDDPLGAETLELLSRERGADGQNVRAGRDSGLDSGRGVLDDDAWMLAVFLPIYIKAL